MKVPLSAQILRVLLRSGLRGRTRLTILLADKLTSLQAVPIQWDDLPPLYLDLRVITSHALLTGVVPDENEQRLIRRIVVPGDVVWDIGAYMGYYSLLFSHLVCAEGKVCSFEPNLEVLPSLKRTLQPLANVTLYPFALADESREASLVIPRDPSMSSLVDWTNGRVGKTHTIACRLKRLDDLVGSGTIPRPHFIKCDVEGAELMVFRGANRTLNCADAPFVLFEANVNSANAFGESIMSAMDFLASLPLPQYSFFQLSDSGQMTRVKALNVDHSNVLAVPASRLARWPELASCHSVMF